MERDRNLLFAIFAAQIRGLEPQLVIEAGAAWVTDPSKPLSARLVEAGALTEMDAEFLNRLVDAAVQAHDGNASQALASVGGEEQVSRTFHGSLVLRPSGGLETRPMSSDSFTGAPEIVLSTVEEHPGRYSQISEYGRGGMGRVLLVHDEHMGRDVALKELMLPKSEWPGPGASPAQGSAAVTARFLQEARLTGKLEHPAIVPVYELGRRKNGTLYYTMKLVRGQTLSKALRGCRTLQDRLGLLGHFVDMCQAIAYAHSRGVIHRDIKPANVMIGAFGETVVLDWGLAKGRDVEDIYGQELESTIRNLRLKVKPKAAPDTTPFETRVGEAVGTPHYMPPEQAEGRIKDITERSDIYSLGVVLYELLTGRTPFDGPSAAEVMWRLLNDPAPEIRTLEANAPPELIEVCKKAMSKSPDKRYATASELAEEVKRFMSGSFVQAYKYTPAQVMGRYYRQHRTVVNTALAGAAAVLALGVFSYINILQARNNEREQRLIAEAAQGVAEAARTAEAGARAEAERSAYIAQLRLAQEYLDKHEYVQAREALWAAPEPQRGTEWGLLAALAHPDMYLVRTPGATIFGAKYSPDGARLAMVALPGAPKIYDAMTGNELVAMEGATDSPTDFDFSPDGTLLCLADTSGTIHVWEVASGKRLQQIRGHVGFAYSSEFSPKGGEILSAGNDGYVRVWDAASGARTAEAAVPDIVAAARFAPAGDLFALECDAGVRVFERNALRERFLVPGSEPVFSPDGGTVATALAENAAGLWSTADGGERARLTGHAGPINAIRFDAAGGRIATASFDRTARLWSAQDGALLQTFRESAPLAAAEFVANGNRLLTRTHENTFKTWDTGTAQAIASFDGSGRTETMLDLTADGRFMVTTAGVDHFQAWDLVNTTGGIAFAAGDMGEATGLHVSGDGKTFVATFGDGGVFCGDTRTGATLGRFATPLGSDLRCVALSHDGQRLALSPDGYSILIFAVARGALETVIHGTEGIVRALDWSPDGRHVVAALSDHTARVWDAGTGQPGVILSGHADEVLSAVFSPDGKSLATGSEDGRVAYWDAASGAQKFAAAGHQGPVRAVAFSASGEQLVTGGADFTARTWDAATGKELRQLLGHAGMLSNVRFVFGDRTVMTCGWDGATRLWHAETGALLLSLGDARRCEAAGEDALLAMRGLGSPLVRIAAAPTDTAALAGGADTPLPVRFAQVLRERRVLAPARDTGKAEDNVTVVRPWTAIAASARAIASWAEGAAPADNGVELGNLPAYTRFELALPGRGRVLRVNGSEANTPVAFSAALTQAAGESAPAPREVRPLSITVQDGSQRLTYRYELAPVHEIETAVVLPREQIKELLEWQRLRVAQQRMEAAVGIDRGEQGGIHMEPVATVSAELMDALRIESHDRLIRLNGESPAGFDGFESALTALASALPGRAEGRIELVEGFRRGDLVHRNLIIQSE